MPPSQFYIRLQHGITGGFIPPTPSAVHQLSRSAESSEHVVVNSAVRPDGQPSLVSSAAPKKIAIDSHTVSLIEELQSILESLPMEKPPGSEDIYGLDTGITWGSDDLEWQNGAPSGCVQGTSEVKASHEEKRKFKRAVDIVNELINKDA